MKHVIETFLDVANEHLPIHVSYRNSGGGGEGADTGYRPAHVQAYRGPVPDEAIPDRRKKQLEST